MMLSWLFSDPLPVGAAAPDFSVSDDSGHTLTLSAPRGPAQPGYHTQISYQGGSPESTRFSIRSRSPGAIPRWNLPPPHFWMEARAFYKSAIKGTGAAASSNPRARWRASAAKPGPLL